MAADIIDILDAEHVDKSIMIEDDWYASPFLVISMYHLAQQCGRQLGRDPK